MPKQLEVDLDQFNDNFENFDPKEEFNPSEPEDVSDDVMRALQSPEYNTAINLKPVLVENVLELKDVKANLPIIQEML